MITKMPFRDKWASWLRIRKARPAEQELVRKINAMQAKLDDRASRLESIGIELSRSKSELQNSEVNLRRAEKLVLRYAPVGFRTLPPESLRLNIGMLASNANFLFQGESSSTRVREIFGDNPTGPILDWGCGSGRTLNWLLPVGTWAQHWHGCDVDREAIGWLLEQGIRNAAVCNDFPPLPYPDEYFAGVYAFSVLTHIHPNRHQEWLEEIRRVLRAGGRAYLTIQGDAIVAAKRITDKEVLRQYTEDGWAYVKKPGHYKDAALVSEKLARKTVEKVFRLESYAAGGYNELMDGLVVRRE